jgi:glutamate--cysteine ligase
LRLIRGSEEIELAEWGGEVLADCGPIAAALDRANGGNAYRKALATAVAALADADSTPSARVLEAMARDYGNSYVRFVLALSRAHRQAILELPLSVEVAERFAHLAEESLAEQRRVEAADTVPFEVYRQRYLSSPNLNV